MLNAIDKRSPDIAQGVDHSDAAAAALQIELAVDGLYALEAAA